MASAVYGHTQGRESKSAVFLGKIPPKSLLTIIAVLSIFLALE